jgi:hypothetical protein
MTQLSNFAENKIGDHVFRGVQWTSPGNNVWVGLHSADPGEAGAGAEVSGGSYARVQVGGSANWGAPSSRQIVNALPFNFPTPSADWGSVTHFCFWDAVSAGNPIMYAPLAQAMNILSGGVVGFAAGQLTARLQGAFSNYLSHALLNHIFRGSAYTMPTVRALSLYTTALDNADTGTELAAAGYARQDITAWDALSNGATANTNVVTFPQAGANWITSHIGLRDALSGGNLLFFATKAYSIGLGGVLSIPAGDVDLSVS